jgi:hypothetical protein
MFRTINIYSSDNYAILINGSTRPEKPMMIMCKSTRFDMERLEAYVSNQYLQFSDILKPRRNRVTVEKVTQ